MPVLRIDRRLLAVCTALPAAARLALRVRGAADRVRETVDCGRGSDTARIDRRDRVRGRERVSRG